MRRKPGRKQSLTGTWDVFVLESKKKKKTEKLRARHIYIYRIVTDLDFGKISFIHS